MNKRDSIGQKQGSDKHKTKINRSREHLI